MIVVGLDKDLRLAKSIAQKAKAAFSKAVVTRFPDSEIKVCIPDNISKKKVAIVKSLFPANDSIMEVLFTAKTCRELGAKKIILVCPYLAYMRQDIAFHKGEAVSAKIMADLLSRYVDVLVTVDPHLHRIKSLGSIFKIKAVKLSAVGLIAGFIKKNLRNVMIIGPDIESKQWDRKVAKLTHSAYIILKKHRKSSYNINLTFSRNMDVASKNIVIIDDIISTGRTLLKTIKHLKTQGPKSIYCFCTHGIFASDAAQKIRKIGARIISTNTIQNKYSFIDVSGIIAEALKKV